MQHRVSFSLWLSSRHHCISQQCYKIVVFTLGLGFVISILRLPHLMAARVHMHAEKIMYSETFQ